MDGNDVVMLGKNDRNDLIECGCAGVVPAGEPLCSAQCSIFGGVDPRGTGRGVTHSDIDSCHSSMNGNDLMMLDKNDNNEKVDLIECGGVGAENVAPTPIPVKFIRLEKVKKCEEKIKKSEETIDKSVEQIEKDTDASAHCSDSEFYEDPEEEIHSDCGVALEESEEEEISCSVVDAGSSHTAPLQGVKACGKDTSFSEQSDLLPSAEACSKESSQESGSMETKGWARSSGKGPYSEDPIFLLSVTPLQREGATFAVV